ncbi:MAG: hypothetical protein Q4E12_06165 [Coriobacteriia bacterium]|nr:hypothetical protein [Coriobacteriia bacterium]
MGMYEWEQQQIAAGTEQRGAAARKYFSELDEMIAAQGGEASAYTHRPNYTKTLFAPEHDDIYREFCRFLDLPKPRYFKDLENPMSVDGWTAAEIYEAMLRPNPRLLDIDAAAVYNTMVKLRTQPEITRKVLEFRPTCYQGGCGFEDGAYDKGQQPWQQQQK